MATINNFDKSSTGIDIEFSGYYSGDRASCDFEESLEVVQHESYRVSSVLYYRNYGNVDGYKEIGFHVVGTKPQLVEYLMYHYAHETKTGYMKWTKDDLLDAVEDALYDERSLINYREENKNLVEYGLEIVPSKKLEWVESRGYSQGDYAEIVYCPEDLKSAWGCEVNESELRKEFNHLLWDAPISATLTINGEEYQYFDFDLDEYEWQRDEFIAAVVKESGVDEDSLEDIVPIGLSYS